MKMNVKCYKVIRLMSKVKNREEFEGGLEKRKGKGGKEEK